MKTTRASLICLLVIVGTAASLVYYNLDLYTSIGSVHGLWFDEGANLLVPATLAQTGEYALYKADGTLELFPTWITTGPTVLLPIAGSFELLGVSPASGRLVRGLYLILTVVVFYVLVQWLYDWKVAGLASAFLLTGALADPLARGVFPFEPVTHARFVVGEVPGFFFVLLGVLLWAFALESQSPSRYNLFLILSGFSWGLAIQTKLMYALVLVVYILWAALNGEGRRALAVPVFTALLPGLAWLAYQFVVTGSDVFLQRYALGWPAYSPDQAGFVSSLQSLLGRIWGLSGWGFAILGLPALVYATGCTLIEEPGPRRSVTRFLLTFIFVWMGWYLASALAWPRHSLPALFVTNIFAAAFVCYLGDGLSLPHVRRIFAGWPKRPLGDAHIRAMTVTLLAILLLLNPAKRLVLQTVRDV